MTAEKNVYLHINSRHCTILTRVVIVIEKIKKTDT